MSGSPDQKERTLEAPRKRYRRKVASAKQWERILAAKMGPCRVCFARLAHADPHHLVFREHGGGDLEDNIVPLCRADHDAVHRRCGPIARLLLSHLSDAEYAYLVTYGGEDYAARAYGVAYTRSAGEVSTRG